MPIGLIIMRWDDRIGLEIISKYPKNIKIDKKVLMNIYSLHEISGGETGTVSIKTDTYNIISFYSGPNIGYYFNLLLDLNESFEYYEDILSGIVRQLLYNLNFKNLDFDLSKTLELINLLPLIKFQGRLAYLLADELKYEILKILRTSGSISISELTSILIDQLDIALSIIDLDNVLNDFIKLKLIKTTFINGIPSKLIFLIKDIMFNRRPPVRILENPEAAGLPSQFVDKYIQECRSFFENYNPVGELEKDFLMTILDKDVYNILEILRNSVETSTSLRKKNLPNIGESLKKMFKVNMLCVFDDNREQYYVLKTDYFLNHFFPEYLVNIINTDFYDNIKSNTISIKHLEMLLESLNIIDIEGTSGIYITTNIFYEGIKKKSMVKFISSDLPINELIPPNDTITFLVGAGISMNPPSNIPSARQIARILIETCTPNEEAPKILKLEALRYELIIEGIQRFFDNELKIFNFFDKILQPNIIHYFLANILIQGKYVVTTNFDYLIEQALIESVEEKNLIIPIITKDDFQKYIDPESIIKSGKYPVYKIHGSKRNIITGEKTASSIITTLSDLGKGREKGQTFSIEQYKKPAMSALMKGRILVVIGYSGADDFDIGPTIREFPKLKKLIWIKHSYSDEIKVNKITKGNVIEDNLLGIDQVLANIALEAEKDNREIEIYSIEINTTTFISKYLFKNFNITPPTIDTINENKINFKDWITDIIKVENENTPYELAYFYYLQLSNYEDVLRCAKKGLEIAELNNNIRNKLIWLKNLGEIYRILYDYTNALNNFEEALQISNELDIFTEKIEILKNIAIISKSRSNYDYALKQLDEALSIAKSLNDTHSKVMIYNIKGEIYKQNENLSKANEEFNKALNIIEETGDLTQKAIILNNIGEILLLKQDIYQASENFEDAFKLADNLGNLALKPPILKNIGKICLLKEKHQIALNILFEALKIVENLDDLIQKIHIHDGIAQVYLVQQKYPESIQNFEQSFKLAKRIGDIITAKKYINTIINTIKLYEKSL
ncbi:MAG: SIR2 family protein [Candidatus Helarchaeota archaeon]